MPNSTTTRNNFATAPNPLQERMGCTSHQDAYGPEEPDTRRRDIIVGAVCAFLIVGFITLAVIGFFLVVTGGR